MDYPPGHEFGMEVPKGGAECAKCKFLSGKSNCSNSYFQKWNGSSKLPAPPDQYCCDVFSEGENSMRTFNGEVVMPKKAFKKEHKNLVKTLRKGNPADLQAEAETQEEEMAETPAHEKAESPQKERLEHFKMKRKKKMSGMPF